MDPAVRAVLDEYHARDAWERPIQRSLLGSPDYERRRNEFLLSVGAEVGQLLGSLSKAVRAQVIVEVGTSYGYSTVWLAEAARATGGKVYSLELDAGKVSYARAMLEKAGLGGQVEFLLGDAIASLTALRATVDFVLIDLWKELYVGTFQAVRPHLRAGALVAADNILFPEQYRALSADYVAAVKAAGDFETVTLPVGHGVELSRLNG
jgi:predicted O-methyltransferase YrrM